MSFQLLFESTCISKFLDRQPAAITSMLSVLRIEKPRITGLELQYRLFISESAFENLNLHLDEQTQTAAVSKVRQVSRSTANDGPDGQSVHTDGEGYGKLNWESSVQTGKR